MDAKETFRTFESLEVYRAAREFRKEMYAVSRKLPEIEKFGLVSQMRRAAVSLTNNIAEGHGRYHYLDQIKFILQARGSLEELIDDLNVCADEKYLPAAEIDKLKQNGWRVSQLLGGYIRFLRKCKAGENLQLREMQAEYAATADDEFSDSTM
ncbi:MAG TPA: four helix bundle protein [Verrucomicrobiae bacterium]|nr:four helix bundle protein [Verrucomicrobiae bacterium]